MIRLSKSSISEAEKQAVAEVLNKEYLGMGVEVQMLENMLSDYFGRTALCVSSGTAALQLAVQAVGIGYGDEVLIPSLTYLASFQAVSATGATPIPCDIDENTCILNWKDAEKRLTPSTKAIMPVHYTGGVGNLDELYAFARRYNLRVIEDAAHAFGTVYKQQKVGGFGDISCFSFDGIKNITCGEGGCVVTDDIEIIRKIQDSRLLGVEKDTEKRYAGQRSWEFDVTAQGWRYHMSNIMAAIGIEQLKRFPEMSSKRRLLAKKYDEQLSGHVIIKILDRDYETVVPHIYVVRIKGMRDRKIIQDSLLAKGIQTGIHYQPNHTHSFYKSNTRAAFPVTDKVYSELLTLPLHVDMDIENVVYVCDSLKELCHE
jgi:dTDP-4-amino-4,6-dideoxygalactose transaminase